MCGIIYLVMQFVTSTAIRHARLSVYVRTSVCVYDDDVSMEYDSLFGYVRCVCMSSNVGYLENIVNS